MLYEYTLYEYTLYEFLLTVRVKYEDSPLILHTFSSGEHTAVSALERPGSKRLYQHRPICSLLPLPKQERRRNG